MGCAKFTAQMSVFTKDDLKAFHNSLVITAKAREEGTGKFYHRLAAMAGCCVAVT